MSELMNTKSDRKDFRWTLLTTASALALLGAADTGGALADGDNHPTVWIDLGAQFERVDAGEEQFAPPFVLATPRPGPETISPLSVGHPPRFSIGGEGKITVEPQDTNWVFSLGVRYGRSSARKHVHQQSYPTHPTGFICPNPSSCTPKYQRAVQFMDTATQHSESHVVFDFKAGKDLGIGLFGGRTSSIVSLGVRYAQFGSRSNVAFKSDPDAKVAIKYRYGNRFRSGATYHLNQASLTASGSFRGVGPSISFDSSVPIAGNHDDREITMDWGINAAVLFGRQKARVHHQTTGQYHQGKYYISSSPNYRTTQYKHTPPDQARSHSVVVPNIGGFAGLSFKYDAAKVSFGYRADFFFGAMDGGIDAHESENRSFYGPFATISVGLGG